MAVTPVYGWRLPDGGIAADGPDAFSDLATDIENTLSAGDWSAYTPTWTSNGSQQPSNPATKVGRFKVFESWCDFRVYMSFGGSVNGGKGRLYIGLPVPATSAIAEQWVPCKLYVPTVGSWQGTAQITAGATSALPLFNAHEGTAIAAPWLNNNDSGAAGTGIPAMPGHWTAENGGNIVVGGRYYAG